MPSRRWDPGIRVEGCFATIWRDHVTDSGNQDYLLVNLGRDFGIDKGIYGSLRKLWIECQWWWIQINSQIESRIYTGCLGDHAILIISFNLMEIVLQYFRFGLFGIRFIRFYWDLRSERINLWRYGFMGEYLLTVVMDNWNQYKRIVGGTLCSLIFFLSFFDIKTRKLVFWL